MVLYRYAAVAAADVVEELVVTPAAVAVAVAVAAAAAVVAACSFAPGAVVAGLVV